MIENSFNYNDFSSLNKIKELGRDDKEEALKVVAKQFESMFIKMMLSSMREANKVFENPDFLGGGNESQFYRQMLDEQMALSLSKGKGMGLADSFYRQMKRDYIPERDGEKELIQNLDRRIDQSIANRLKAKNSEAIEAKEYVEVPIPISTMTYVLGNVNNKIKVETKPDTSKLEELQNQFSSPSEFVKMMMPKIEEIAAKMNVNPKAILAQGALETGWGKYLIQDNGKNSFNLFGIKADHRWEGDRVSVATIEFRDNLPKKEFAQFRSYTDYDEGLNDYLNFISNSPRYKEALNAGNSVADYAHALQEAGYATDPNYATKIIKIANSDLIKKNLKE